MWRRALVPTGTCTSVGQEAAAVGVVRALQARDRILTNHRSAGHLLARGADPGRLMAEVMGRVDGYCKGKSGSLHVSVSYAKTVGTCLAAAQSLAERGVEAEVIDLRTLKPIDEATVLASVRKTGRLVVVHEANALCGVGAEVRGLREREGLRRARRTGAPRDRGRMRLRRRRGCWSRQECRRWRRCAGRCWAWWGQRRPWPDPPLVS